MPDSHSPSSRLHAEFGRIASTIAVRDLATAAAFYVEVLGMRVTFMNGDPVGFAILERDAAQLHLTQVKGYRASVHNIAHLMVTDATELYEHLVTHGVRIIKGLRDADYGLRGFVFADPDGNRIDVGQATPTAPTLPSVAEIPLGPVEGQLIVGDITASTEFYTTKLGFRVAFTYGDPPFYAQVTRDEAKLNLRHIDEPVFVDDIREREQLLSASIGLYDSKDLELLYSQYRTNGVEFQQPLQRQPWGRWTFVVRDPDDNLVLFAGAETSEP
jgi:catechol 2,3-dioxygenase-like lactoylglutathione lyase family enzyme